ncbi:MAG TPA: hypothetical protein PKY38_08400, partial [Opitutaceae bacterium]|nr:hypothetical protein [Opitutaceae bacterium]
VLPTLVEPLREEWGAVKAAAVTLASRGDLKAAIKEARAFHHRLCAVRVLDPACGSGNFLYVALEHLKRLEGEVLQLIESFGENMRLDLGGETVDPHQFLGIEINPRAATIAELVLWIGYLQWHHRNRGATEWPEPVLRAFKNIECRDAVLAYDVEEFVTSKMAEADPKIPGLPDDWRRFVDSHSGVIFVWDQKTEKKEPVSGRNIPDEKATVPLRRYTNPAPAKWPRADFIVGNPPFIGNKRMRRDLGDGYVATLRKVCKTVPGSADFVMFWWDHAARLVGAQSAARFGLITTNTITQIQSNKVVANHLAGGLSLSFAIPDHPWVDNADGADVRIAMSACRKGDYSGHCLEVLKEAPLADGSSEISFREFTGKITSRFTTGLDLRKAKPLLANSGVCFQGVKLVGDGFQITKDLRDTFVAESPDNSARLPRYWAGKDLTEIRPLRHVIDLTALTADQARLQFPRLHEHLLTHVKPGRDANRDKGFREKWWLFGRPRMELRAAMRASPRYFVTSEVAEHRVFVALDWPANLIDGGVIAIASPDTFILGVLSSNIHLTWALEAGGNLGVGNDPRYQNEVCFDPFPFPDCTEKQKDKIRQLAEELDAHRKRAQAQHKLGLTDIYNVLEKVRAGEALTAKDKAIHEAALVSTLRQLHDDLDAAVAAAYGWPWPLTDAEILERVVALNAQRAAEEARGHIRWLRPEYQQPLFAGTKQASLGLDDGPTPSKPKAKSLKPKAGAKAPWPKTIADRAKAVESALTAAEHPLTAKDLAKQFSRANENDVQEILETLAALGRAHPGDAKGTYVR